MPSPHLSCLKCGVLLPLRLAGRSSPTPTSTGVSRISAFFPLRHVVFYFICIYAHMNTHFRPSVQPTEHDTPPRPISTPNMCVSGIRPLSSRCASTESARQIYRVALLSTTGRRRPLAAVAGSVVCPAFYFHISPRSVSKELNMAFTLVLYFEVICTRQQIRARRLRAWPSSLLGVRGL